MKDDPRKNHCMTGYGELCHWSFPENTSYYDYDAACRSVPQDYMYGEFEWYTSFEYKPDNWFFNYFGMCNYDCYEKGGKCYFSWPKGERTYHNTKANARCKGPDHN